MDRVKNTQHANAPTHDTTDKSRKYHHPKVAKTKLENLRKKQHHENTAKKDLKPKVLTKSKKYNRRPDITHIIRRAYTCALSGGKSHIAL